MSERIWWCEMENLGWGTTGMYAGEPHCSPQLPEDEKLHSECGWRFVSIEIEETIEISEERTYLLDDAMIERGVQAIRGIPVMADRTAVVAVLKAAFEVEGDDE